MSDNNEEASNASDLGAQPQFQGFGMPLVLMPKFSWKIEDWSIFGVDFESMIHENPLMTFSAKMKYLKGAITGEAIYKISLINLRGS